VNLVCATAAIAMCYATGRWGGNSHPARLLALATLAVIPAAAAPIPTSVGITADEGALTGSPSKTRATLFRTATQASDSGTEVDDSSPQLAADIGSFWQEYISKTTRRSVFRELPSPLGGSALLTFSVGSDKIAIFTEDQLLAAAYPEKLALPFSPYLEVEHTYLGRPSTAAQDSIMQWLGIGLLLGALLISGCLYLYKRGRTATAGGAGPSVALGAGRRQAR